MKLSDISIQRPVFAVVMSLLLLVLAPMFYVSRRIRNLPPPPTTPS